MSTEIINVLDYICGKIGIAIDWSAENVWPQVMDVLGRYRTMMMIGNFMWIVFGFSVMALFIALWRKSIKAQQTAINEKKNNMWWEYYPCSDNASMNVASIVLLVLTFVLGVLFIIKIIESCNILLEWTFVPEIKYLEMLKTYIQ